MWPWKRKSRLPDHLDEHGQPPAPYLTSHRTERGIHELIGLARGLLADGVVIRQEAEYLLRWLEQNPDTRRHQPVRDLEACMRHILSSDAPPAEMERGLTRTLRHITTAPLEVETTDQVIHQLIGVARGTLADGAVAHAEAQALLDWMEQNREHATTWPANVLYPRIRAILEDGVVDPEEEKELLELLVDLTGTPQPSGQAASTLLPLDEPMPVIEFESRLFCLTGRFCIGTREQVTDMIELRGGTVHGTVVKKLDYLVIAELGSRDWAHSSYGRKIEKAVGYRAKGVGLSIVSEEHLAAHLG